jgi:hypothetical protein
VWFLNSFECHLQWFIIQFVSHYDYMKSLNIISITNLTLTLNNVSRWIEIIYVMRSKYSGIYKDVKLNVNLYITDHAVILSTHALRVN